MSEVHIKYNDRPDEIPHYVVTCSGRVGMLWEGEAEYEAILSLQDTIAKQEAEIAELVAALQTLTNTYVINQGSDSEFIACITPRGAYGMTKKERKAEQTWQKWDRARALLTKHAGGEG